VVSGYVTLRKKNSWAVIVASRPNRATTIVIDSATRMDEIQYRYGPMEANAKISPASAILSRKKTGVVDRLE
jgi:hypothetical protein